MYKEIEININDCIVKPGNITTEEYDIIWNVFYDLFIKEIEYMISSPRLGETITISINEFSTDESILTLVNKFGLCDYLKVEITSIDHNTLKRSTCYSFKLIHLS